MGRVTKADPIPAAEAVWVATALLHRENPKRRDFTIREIVRRAEQEDLNGSRPGIQKEALQNSVANKEPTESGRRFLYATAKNRRRLWRSGDDFHLLRLGKLLPDRDKIPVRYRDLLGWYEKKHGRIPVKVRRRYDPLYALRGLGKEIWEGIDPDEYVRSLRED